MTTTTDSPSGTNAGSPTTDLHPKERERRAGVSAYPFAAVTIQTTGIHPSTGRMVAIDIVTCNAEGDPGETFHAVFNPQGDPGPQHQHGLTRAEIADGQRFSSVLKTLDRLLDDREIITHDAPYTWGFIVSEARRAMTAAARHNRSRSRGRGRGRRRRQKVGHVPAPKGIVDTLATARRQAIKLDDTRLGSVARHCGVLVPSPVATPERMAVAESQTSRRDSETLIKLWKQQRDNGPTAHRLPDDLRPDRFGLQRSAVRVDAAEAPRMHTNPGRYEPGKELRRGMEFVVAPEISMDPNDIIQPAVQAELNYCEKLSRETSVVVCNQTTDLTGKAMHAQRKGIPLLSDAAFIAALERVQEALPEAEESDSSTSRDSHHTAGGSSHNGGESSRGRNRSRGRGRGRNRGRGRGRGRRRTHSNRAQNNHSQNRSESGGGSSTDTNPNSDSDAGHDKAPKKRRRRRGRRGARRNQESGASRQAGNTPGAKQ